MRNRWFSSSAGRLWLCAGGAAVAFLIFFRITRELIEGDVSAFDRAVLLAIAGVRTPPLTVVAVDVTALGSITLVTLFSALTLGVLLLMRDRKGALQLLFASAGAGALTWATKSFIERARPDEVRQLIEVTGYSYPSGHSVATASLYLTIAIIAGRYVRHSHARIALFLAVSLILLIVGASRVYLGVHYATDVVSGLALGVAWALGLAGLFAHFGQRG